MKIAFLFLCVLCAGLVSLLVVGAVTGKAPFSFAAAGSTPKTVIKPAAPVVASILMEDERKSLEDLIKVMESEKNAIKARESELAVREESLKLREAACDRLKMEVEHSQKVLDASIAEVKLAQQSNLRRLAEMYAKMEPASASILLREMERKHAASILNLTTERAAAAIMDATIQAGGTNAAVVAEWANIIRTMRIEKMSKAKE
jgi:flagellar motility protein MotE (MotC chaperone)